jgi:hypothetical protein
MLALLDLLDPDPPLMAAWIRIRFRIQSTASGHSKMKMNYHYLLESVF